MAHLHDAEREWAVAGRQAWRRTPAGWPDDEQVHLVRIAHDAVRHDPFVQVQAQRRIKRGQHKGSWTDHGGRGDIHTREEYMTFLGAVIEAGFRAQFITTLDVATLLDSLT